MRWAARFLAAIGIAAAGQSAGAQDSVVVRHVLALDISRLEPFHRTYDILVHHRDSAVLVGTRELSLDAAEHAGHPGWLMVERRTGAVPAVESLFVAPDVRPVHWSSWLGAARLAAVFVGDTIMGATTVGAAKQNLLLTGRPDLLVSLAMVELVLGLLPLEDQWRDSAAILSVTMSGRHVRPAELIALGDETIAVDSLTDRRTRVVALRTDERSALFWVDRETRAVLRMQQVLPPHIGSLLEYRLRPAEPPPAPALPPPR